MESLVKKFIPDGALNIEEISRKNIDTKKKDKIYYLEFSSKVLESNSDYDLTKEKPFNFIKYKKISEFPSSTRDFSFLLSDKSVVELVINMLAKINDINLKKHFIFDFYENENKVKIGYRFIFQSNNRTLSEVDINNSINKILMPVLDIEGVTIPGYDDLS